VAVDAAVAAAGVDVETDPDEPLDYSGLYNGIQSNILKEAPNAAIYLGVYEIIKGFLLSTTAFHDLPLLVFVIAGALGDAIGSIVRCPAEIVNKRLQLAVNDNATSAVREAFFTPEGRQSSLVAWGAVLWRDVPYGGLQIALYEFGRQYVSSHGAVLGVEPGVLADVITGAIAGMVAAMLTTPADVLVTRLSVQNPQSYLETRRYMGVWSTLLRIVRDDGVGALFSGVLQRGIYYAPLIGLFFALYEATRNVVADPHTVVVALASLQDRLGSITHMLHDAVFASMPTMGFVVPAMYAVSLLLSDAGGGM
jgi:Mitochondrial carrier protein